MQFYNEVTLYFRVLPRDFVAGHLQRFCFDYRYLREYLFIPRFLCGSFTFDLNGDLVLPTFERNEVCVHSPKDGSLLRKIGEGHHSCPFACAVDKTNRLYVSEHDHVCVFQPDGSFARKFYFEATTYCLTVKDDNLFVCTSKGMIVVSTITNSIVNQIDTCSVTTTISTTSKHVVISSFDRLQFFESDGTLVRTTNIGSWSPNWLAVDIHDNIYATDGECRVYTNDGQLLGNFGHNFAKIVISRTTGVLAATDETGIHFFH